MPVLPPDGSADHRALARALDLARQSASFASPNPAVGCVLMRSGHILGEGAHRYDGRDHAEIVALKAAAQAGLDVRGATAYVTLEPCSHHGRTGPCADALLAAGIARCVVATVDPNPLVRGRGLDRLRAAGVVVDLLDPASALAQQARRLNDSFAFSVQHGRPFVTLKSALSLDGKTAPPPARRVAGEPFWLTGPAARAQVQQLRHENDALLTGIGTVLADDPQLSDRSGLPRRRPLLRVVLDSQLQTPPNSRLVQEAQNDLLLLTATSDPSTRPSWPSPQGGHSPDARDERPSQSTRVEILPIPQPGSLHQVLALLHDRGIRSVLVEAGPTLNGALLREDLVDKLVLYYADRELGPDALPFATGQPSPYLLQQQLTSQTHTTLPHGQTEDARITGYLHDPWRNV